MSLGDIQTRIEDELKRPDLSSQIALAIQTSIRFYQGDPWWFTEARAERTASAGESYYGLPTDFLELLQDPVCRDSSTHWTLDYRTDTNIDEIDTANYTGKPALYTIFDEQLRVYPTPDTGDYVFELGYRQKLATLINSTDENPWTEDVEEIVRLHAKIDVMENVMRGMEELQEAGRLRLRETEVYTKLINESERRTSGSYLRPREN